MVEKPPRLECMEIDEKTGSKNRTVSENMSLFGPS
jgi:hypothetical protein